MRCLLAPEDAARRGIGTSPAPVAQVTRPPRLAPQPKPVRMRCPRSANEPLGSESVRVALPRGGTRTRSEPDRWLLLLSPKRRPKTGHLSWGFSPLHRHTALRPTPDTEVSRTAVPTTVGRRPVVSHHLGSLLRSTGRGLVASRCRSWGSPGFRVPGRRSVARGLLVPSHRCSTPRRSPHPIAVPRHRGRSLLAVSPRSPPKWFPLASTSRSCSIECSGPCQLGCPP
jgi:hypothetical protein